MSDKQYWDEKALLLRLREMDMPWMNGPGQLIEWMRNLRSFTQTDSNAGANVACRLVGVENTHENKLELALACGRLIRSDECAAK